MILKQVRNQQFLGLKDARDTHYINCFIIFDEVYIEHNCQFTNCVVHYPSKPESVTVDSSTVESPKTQTSKKYYKSKRGTQ